MPLRLTCVPLWKTFVLRQKKVILKILGYSRYTIWTPKSAKKVIAENSDLSYPNLHNWWVKLVMLGLPSDYNQNMAIKFIATFSVLLFFPSSCQAKPENFSEAQCKVLPVGQETAPQFCVEASEKGVRIVYLDLNFRNDSYRPLESENEFLPNRWV